MNLPQNLREIAAYYGSRSMYLGTISIGETTVRAAAVVEAADQLVALWKAQKIAGLSRAERNAAIEGAREKLIAVLAV